LVQVIFQVLVYLPTNLFQKTLGYGDLKKGFDIRVDKNYPDTLEEPAKSFFLTYAYQNPKTLNWVLCTDNARFFNHSEMANTHCVEDPEDEDTANVASYDIQIGEELFVDYREFDTDPFYGFEK